MGLLRHSVLAAAAAVMLTVGLVPLARPAPAEARPFGSDPLDDVINAANAAAQPGCGLSGAALAAMMLSVVFPETGAQGSVPPSPMTLSRFDSNASLFAFNDPSTANPFRRAFFHPGVGLWQFDSAGLGQPHAASYFMYTGTAAPAAAATMAQRWCASAGDPAARRASVWGPWNACKPPANVCEAVFNGIFDGANLVNLERFANVSRSGGMLPRRCQVLSTGAVVDCWWVNPALAEGYGSGGVGWANPNSAAPAPLSLPFYVYEYNGTEFRHWLSIDTGFGSDINATRPLTRNARNGGVTWTSGPGMCDVATGRGGCAQLPPVGPAVTPLSTDPRMAGPGRGPAATAWNGRVALAERRSDGSVVISSIAPPLWSGNTYVGGTSLSDPDLVSLGGDHLQVVVLGTDRAIWHRTYSGGGFSGWASLGGAFSSGPAVASSNPDRVEVFARGLDGAMWAGSIINGAFAGWISLGGGFLSEPTVSSWGPGRLDVFAVGLDRALWHRALAGGLWGEWERLGGVLASAPGAASSVPNQIDVAARVPDGSVYVLRWDGASWQGWSPIGGSIAAAPDVAATGAGVMAVARAGNGFLYRAERGPSGWTSWSPVP